MLLVKKKIIFKIQGLLTLKLRKENELNYFHHTNKGGIYGYTNNIEKVGFNAYSNDKLNQKLTKQLFLMKRKIIVY